MRVSARSAWQTGRDYICARAPGRAAATQAWAERVAADTRLLASTAEEQDLRRLLAEACLCHALLRHAGTVEEAYTPKGKMRVQRGKDLRRVRRIIASGGFLSRRGSPLPIQNALHSGRRPGWRSARAQHSFSRSSPRCSTTISTWSRSWATSRRAPGRRAELASLTTGRANPAEGHGHA